MNRLAPYLDYLLAAVGIDSSQAVTVRATLQRLLLPGQRRLHMKDESASRRRAIISAVLAHDVEATIYNAGRRGPEGQRRRRCLEAVVSDAGGSSDLELILERDDTLVEHDRRTIFHAARTLGCVDLRYEFQSAAAEPLLALPDAIVWSWARGHDWQRRIRPAVNAVVQV